MTFIACFLVGLIVGALAVLAWARERLAAVAAGRVAGTEELESRQRAVAELVQPLTHQLEVLNRERLRSGAQLSEQIRALGEAQERLRSQTGALVSALARPNVRGQWGQMQLRRVVEMAGMLRHCDFIEQATVSGPEDRVLRPDMIVRLPGDAQVPVDAKAPLAAVLDAYEAESEAQRADCMAEHARLLRRHVKALADKAYWSGLDRAPDFIVLFLPGEHLYSAAYEADPELVEYAMARRVLITTPTTLLALLHSVGYGWQQERVAQSAELVAEIGRELHGRILRLSGLLARVGERLNGTVRAYNETVGSYESRVLPSARRLAEHGVVGEQTELAGVAPVDLAARTLGIGAEPVRPVSGEPSPGIAGEPAQPAGVVGR